MKKLILLLLFIPLVFSCDSSSPKSDVDFLLQNMAQEINKKCPMVINKDTRLNNVAILSNKTIRYNYTLVNLNVDEIDADLLKKESTTLLNNDVKTNNGLKKLRSYNVTFAYYYADKNGKFIFEHKVTPSIYK